MNQVKITSNQIADYFIALGNETGEAITNLRLQKLVYYAQAWHLANFSEALFDEEFEAWVHGPVIKSLYRENKSFGYKPIDKQIKLTEAGQNIPSDKLDFLQEVADVYMKYTAYDLEKMTHQEDPWIIARNGLAEDEICDSVITKESMITYYAQKIV